MTMPLAVGNKAATQLRLKLYNIPILCVVPSTSNVKKIGFILGQDAKAQPTANVVQWLE